MEPLQHPIEQFSLAENHTGNPVAKQASYVQVITHARFQLYLHNMHFFLYLRLFIDNNLCTIQLTYKQRNYNERSRRQSRKPVGGESGRSLSPLERR